MSLCKSKISNKGGEVKEGDKIGAAFDHGKLDHPVYGKVEDCSGIVPLLRPYGELKICPLVYDQKALYEFAKEIRAEFQYLWEEDLDEDVEKRLVDFIMMSAIMFYTQGIEIRTKEGKMHVVIIAVGFIIDDLFDGQDEIESSGFSYKSVTKLMEKVWEGDLSDMPSLAPKMVPYLKFIADWKAANNESFEASKDFLGPLNRERSNLFAVTTLMMETRRKGEESFSDDTLLDFNGFQSGVLYGLEAMAIQSKIHVPHEVREDVLFRRLGICVANAANLKNAIYGLPRDLDNGYVNDSQVLREVVNNGLSLEAAYKKTLKHLTNAIQDVRVASKKLKERYADEPQVLRYVDLAINTVDHQSYCYMHVSRYGKLNLKIQKM